MTFLSSKKGCCSLKISLRGKTKKRKSDEPKTGGNILNLGTTELRKFFEKNTYSNAMLNLKDIKNADVIEIIKYATDFLTLQTGTTLPTTDQKKACSDAICGIFPSLENKRQQIMVIMTNRIYNNKQKFKKMDLRSMPSTSKDSIATDKTGRFYFHVGSIMSKEE